MQRDLVIKGRSLGGSSDLTILAPIQPGFVESLESVTYKTRVKRVLDALHIARTASHEHHAARLLSDSIERVGAIQSVRVVVLEPEDKVMLAVTFDGSWAAYMRVLWDKVGTLLDLIFCNTVDYVTAREHTYAEWSAWVHRFQVETGFHYGPPDATARDVLFHRRLERMSLRGAGGELAEMRATLPSAEAAVSALASLAAPQADDAPVVPPHPPRRLVAERIRNGLQGLAGLYRLADLHRPGTPDGDVLRFAAIDLLKEFVELWASGAIADTIDAAAKSRFERQIDWLYPGRIATVAPRACPAPAEAGGHRIPAAVLADVQGGILRPSPPVTHGALLLLAFDHPAAAASLLDWAGRNVTPGNADVDATPDRPACTVGFTPAGLRAAGLDEATLDLFPEDFRQGMAARCGLLGDVRNNHPRRWRLPRAVADRATLAPADCGHAVVDLDTVHAVLQLRCHAPASAPDLPVPDPSHPLRGAIDRCLSAAPGLRLLAVESMRRRLTRDGSRVEEHFGYADGQGQPDLEDGPEAVPGNRVHLGEVVVGPANAADFPLDADAPQVPCVERERLRWLRHGSFLALRKYRQDVDAMEAAVDATAREMADVLGGELSTHREVVYAKLMGRRRDGTSPVAASGAALNAFDYTGDRQGRTCPLGAHVRLAHPRDPAGASARPPRLMRRSMSYGPDRGAQAPAGVERGLFFMGYSASLSEQYEVIQRWLSGGNSTGTSSAHGCPVVGVPENGVPRHFRFEHPHPVTNEPHVFRVQLEPATGLFDEPRTLARLEWGMYLFTPSITALRRLATLAHAAAGGVPHARVPWRVDEGRATLARLRQVEADAGAAAARLAWKAALEDPVAIDRLEAAGLLAAVRHDHGGVLRTPYGVIVARRELLHEVLLDRQGRYTLAGHLARMHEGIGDIYLGHDASPAYDRDAPSINAAATALASPPAGTPSVFDVALGAARRKLDAIIGAARQQSAALAEPRFEVTFDAREVVDEVLGDLCDAWFGLKDSPFLKRGPADWAWRDDDPPLYPGHFTALSRYLFQPHPGALPKELARRYGRTLTAAMQDFVAQHRRDGTLPQWAGHGDAPIAKAVFQHPDHLDDPAWVARTLAGVMMGFIAPIIGAVLNVLREWQREAVLPALRVQLAGRTDLASAASLLSAPMAAAAAMRPMPQVIWRTARCAHRLGLPGGPGVDVAAGDIVVLALVSGTHQSLEDGEPDGRLMFGGERKPAGQPHPTHACPGHDAGLQAILGTVTALLARREVLRNGPLPLTFVAEGVLP